MPATTSPIETRRGIAAGSPKRWMPSAAVPMTPIPVHRIGRAERQAAQRKAEEAEAQAHAGERRERRQDATEALGIFQADGPADLEQAGDEKIGPSHDDLRASGRVVPAAM